MKIPSSPLIPKDSLAERFGRTAIDGLWAIKVFNHPNQPGFFCYSMRADGVNIGNGLPGTPLLHGHCETIADAVEAGVIQVFTKAKKR